MNNRKRYRKSMNSYYALAINDEEILVSMNMDKKHQKRIVHRWMITAATFLLVSSTLTMVAVAAGWNFFSEVFQKGFDDTISAELVENGIIQELGVVNENDDFYIKLAAFTGDKETHIAMFELTPKKDFGNIKEVSLLGQTFSPAELEDGTYMKYSVSEIKGYELLYDEEKNTYYFSYQLPPFWVKVLEDDIILHITGIRIYSESGVSNLIESDLLFKFTPNRSMLEDALKIAVNQVIIKDVYDVCSFTDDYSNPYLHTGNITSPMTERKIKITDVTISKYKTSVSGIIMEEDIDEQSASGIWNQFTEPRFITNHYWNGLEAKDAYDLAVVDNTERIRLFVDDVEIELNEESLLYMPGKGHDGEGNLITKGYYSCAIEFKDFDYEGAMKVEIHFGDTVIALK